MPMKHAVALHPRNEIAIVVEEEEEVFNPEAGKVSDAPFGEHVAPSEPREAEQEAPSEEADSTETVSELDDNTEESDNGN